MDRLVEIACLMALAASMAAFYFQQEAASQRAAISRACLQRTALLLTVDGKTIRYACRRDFD